MSIDLFRVLKDRWPYWLIPMLMAVLFALALLQWGVPEEGPNYSIEEFSR